MITKDDKIKIIKACNEYFQREDLGETKINEVENYIGVCYTTFDFDSCFSNYNGHEQEVSLQVYLDLTDLSLKVTFYGEDFKKNGLIESYDSVDEMIENVKEYTFQFLYSESLYIFEQRKLA